MLDSLFDDGLNPRLVAHSPVFRDELGPNGALPSDRLAGHIAAAIDAFHAGNASTADELDVVRDLSVEFLSAVHSTGVLRIDVWLDQLDATTCTYGFTCSSADGLKAHARGERRISKIDAELLRPSQWSASFLEQQSSKLKALHNCA